MIQENNQFPESTCNERNRTQRPVKAVDQSPACAKCSAAVDTSRWHPIVTTTDHEGNLDVHPFCSMGCRADWVPD